MTSKELDTKEIEKIARKNETAGAVFTNLSRRERNRIDTDLRRFRNELTDTGHKIIPAEFMDVFRDLERLGVGKLLIKSGKPARFRWFYAMKTVGGVGKIGKPDSPGGAPAERLQPEPKRVAAPITAVIVKVILQSGEVVDLPAKLSDSDKAALISIIQRHNYGP